MIRVFIGYDSCGTVAFHVFSHSIQARASRPVSITPLALTQLDDLFRRERDLKHRTESQVWQFRIYKMGTAERHRKKKFTRK
ncbi:hypothetical protein [Azospirillum sp. SYSU D00513]|uniref:hypothetical protein n=1 Tax=Azospirillum sp. SYSU D00513 TaxID=2812561 RepID=UPI001A965B68|nr:hypothetical protein [Azospirillum sp. SYSU D00513]